MKGSAATESISRSLYGHRIGTIIMTVAIVLLVVYK